MYQNQNSPSTKRGTRNFLHLAGEITGLLLHRNRFQLCLFHLRLHLVQTFHIFLQTVGPMGMSPLCFLLRLLSFFQSSLGTKRQPSYGCPSKRIKKGLKQTNTEKLSKQMPAVFPPILQAPLSKKPLVAALTPQHA